MLIRPFDPWENPLCTCPPKLSLNPYTGCTHGCLYCYAASYVPRFRECRPKQGLLRRLEKEISRLGEGVTVSMANSSDPYPPEEFSTRLTRGCLELLKKAGIKVQVVTKSSLVARDADLLRSMRASVAITVTTLDQDLSRRLEPGAPSPQERINAIVALSGAGVPITARIDPIIPGINEDHLQELVGVLKGAKVSHIVSSTYKARTQNLELVLASFPRQAPRLKELYLHGENRFGTRYLDFGYRVRVMEDLRAICHERGVTFSTCREGLWVEGSCDGSHLIP